MRKVPVMGWIFSPQNLYVEILNLSTSKCSLIWGKERAFREVIKIRWGQEGQFFSKIKGNLTIKKYMCISIYLSIYLSIYMKTSCGHEDGELHEREKSGTEVSLTDFTRNQPHQQIHFGLLVSRTVSQ